MPDSMNISTYAYIALVCQLSLGFVFLISVYFKIRQPGIFARQVISYSILPDQIAYMFGFILIPLEIYVALSLLTGITTNFALLVACFLLVVFLAAVAINVRRGRKISCGCFGQTSEQISLRTIARLSLLLLLTIIPIILRNVRNEALIHPLSLTSDLSSLIYLIQAILLAALVITIGIWLLSLPELAGLIRQFYHSQRSSGKSRS